MANELKLEQVITNVMINHIGEEGRHIGEGGCPRIQWYALRNELIKAITAWNTRPAAPDVWLETVSYEVFYAPTREWTKTTIPNYYRDNDNLVRELVTRSQAEAVIASEVKQERELAEKQLSEVVNRMSDDYLVLKADNAALTARVKGLEQGRAEILNQQDKGWRELQNRAETLETQLSAARKALEFYADASKWDDGYFKSEDYGTVLRAYPSSVDKDQGDKARAVLEAKP